MSNQNYYELLGVERTASFNQIKSAFRVQAKKYHPDYHPGDKEAEARFKQINEAYEVLKDDQKRAAYDQYGHEAYVNGMGRSGAGAGFSGFDFSGTGFESIFEEMFGGAFGGDRSHFRQSKGSDVRYDLNITLDDSFRGTKKSITVETYVKCDSCNGKGGETLETCPTCGGSGHVRQRQGFFVVETTCPVCHGIGKSVKNPCKDCSGSGRIRKKRTLEVNIPAGVDTGVRMRLAGEGNVGLNGGISGDLYVFLTVQPHDIFVRQGDDLYCEIPVPMTTAALGGTVKIPTMSGKAEVHTVSAGLQSGDQVRLKGKGMPILKSGGAVGNMYISFKVETPTNLTDRQKELLREFATESGEHQQACTDFFCRLKKIWQDWTD